MTAKLLSYIASPLITYFDATIGLCCTSWSARDEFEHQAVISEKARKARESDEQRYSYRPRKNSFSLRLCIQKQREMTSPNRNEVERSSWVEEELTRAITPRHNIDILQ